MRGWNICQFLQSSIIIFLHFLSLNHSLLAQDILDTKSPEIWPSLDESKNIIESVGSVTIRLVEKVGSDWESAKIKPVEGAFPCKGVKISKDVVLTSFMCPVNLLYSASAEKVVFLVVMEDHVSFKDNKMEKTTNFYLINSFTSHPLANWTQHHPSRHNIMLFKIYPEFASPWLSLPKTDLSSTDALFEVHQNKLGDNSDAKIDSSVQMNYSINLAKWEKNPTDEAIYYLNVENPDICTRFSGLGAALVSVDNDVVLLKGFLIGVEPKKNETGVKCDVLNMYYYTDWIKKIIDSDNFIDATELVTFRNFEKKEENKAKKKSVLNHPKFDEYFP